MEEMKQTVNMHHCGNDMKVGQIYAITDVYNTITRKVSFGLPNTPAHNFCESPTVDPAASVGRAFKVLSTDLFSSGTATIVEVVKDTAGNWVEKVRPDVDDPKPVSGCKRVIKHHGAAAYQDPGGHYEPIRNCGKAVGDVFLVKELSTAPNVRIFIIRNNGCNSTNYIESPYANPHDAVGKAFKVIAGDSINWTIEKVPVDQVGMAASAGAAVAPYPPSVTSKIDNIATSSIKSEPSTIVKEQIMVFQGIVMREKTVPAGVGVTTGVKKSEVIYVTDKPVVASDSGAAKAIILSRAIVALGKDLDVEDTTQPVTVQALQYSNI